MPYFEDWKAIKIFGYEVLNEFSADILNIACIFYKYEIKKMGSMSDVNFEI